MKTTKIFMTSLALMTLTACNDYLDVDAPTKYTEDFIVSDVNEQWVSNAKVKKYFKKASKFC